MCGEARGGTIFFVSSISDEVFVMNEQQRRQLQELIEHVKLLHRDRQPTSNTQEIIAHMQMLQLQHRDQAQRSELQVSKKASDQPGPCPSWMKRAIVGVGVLGALAVGNEFAKQEPLGVHVATCAPRVQTKNCTVNCIRPMRAMRVCQELGHEKFRTDPHWHMVVSREMPWTSSIFASKGDERIFNEKTENQVWRKCADQLCKEVRQSEYTFLDYAYRPDNCHMYRKSPTAEVQVQKQAVTGRMLQRNCLNPHSREMNPTQARKHFIQIDQNGDGKIDKREYDDAVTNGLVLSDQFPRHRDGSGAIDETEYNDHADAVAKHVAVCDSYKLALPVTWAQYRDMQRALQAEREIFVNNLEAVLHNCGVDMDTGNS